MRYTLGEVHYEEVQERAKSLMSRGERICDRDFEGEAKAEDISRKLSTVT